MIDVGKKLSQLRIARSALDSQRALPGRWRHQFCLEKLAHFFEQPQPLQPRRGDHEGVELTSAELANSRIHVAANTYRCEVVPAREDLRHSARTAGRHRCTTRQ